MTPRISLCTLGVTTLLLGGCLHSRKTTTLAPSRPPLRAEPVNVAPAELASAYIPVNSEDNTFQTLAYFNGPMPTGVTVSAAGRMFVSFPRWGDNVDFTVGEVRNGQVVAFPHGGYNRLDSARPASCLVSVQSVVVDANNCLWLLDTGSVNFGPVMPGAAKLVGIDLTSNKIIKVISFPPDVALATTYLNDIRFDLHRGVAGTAYITDSASEGPAGIVVVDLDTGKSWRRLSGHPSTQADPNLVPVVEGESLMQRKAGEPPQKLKMGADGIAISPDGKTLYYCPLVSHHLFSVSTDALSDPNQNDDAVAATVQDLGDRGFASDGLETDKSGRIYLTDYDHNGIRVRETDGTYRYLLRSPKIIWPDTLSIASDGYLYFTNNQLDRMARFHDGIDHRERPFTIMRVKAVDGPVVLK